MLRCLKGDFGTPIVIDYCIVETMTLLQQRRIPRAIEALMEFLRSNKFTFFFIAEKNFNSAIDLAIEKKKDSLSVTDCSQVVVSKELNIGSIATFDSKLGSFFEKTAGKGYFDALDDTEKRLLMRKTSRS